MTLARIEYAIRTATWQTPRGRLAEFAYRENTSDWNTISSVMQPTDEYRLAGVHVNGLALDIGAHIGSVAIAIALDNPDAEVIAVEPIAENAALAEENAGRNGLSERVLVLTAAAAAPGVKDTLVFWRAQGNENAEHHAFIGNSALVYDSVKPPHETATVGCVSLGTLLMERTAAFMKIDCEGCEWGVLTDPAVAKVERIVGEWHPVNGHTSVDVQALLGLTHDVETEPVGPGGFRAARR